MASITPGAGRFFVTGAASGIGQGLARAILQAGGRVFATDINEGGMAGLEGATCRGLDVRDPEAWSARFEEAVSEMGGVDCLLNVAGYLKPGYLHEVPAGEVDRHFDINVKGVIHGMRVAAAYMRPRGEGHIINIASLAGIAPIAGISLYSASKFAVRGISLSAAQELNPLGVKVSVVCPDAVKTPMLDLQVHYEEAALTFSGSEALTTEDVVEAILGPVLRKAPLEYALPFGRGLMARVAGVFPGAAMGLAPSLKAKGLKRQKEQKGRQGAEDV